uniref:RBBP9/YdeN family alpha/beta hydrolase n=1 Tax=Stappia sp. TaxID=1870903 RepID=UPI003BAA9226
MKISETDILLVPGYGETPAAHWLHRWQEKIPTARFVELPSTFHPVRKQWVETITAGVESAERPVVLVAHSLGAIACVHAAHALPADKVKAAFLVAPTDLARSAPKPAFEVGDFLPVPKGPLPFRARVVASRNDPHCDYDTAHGFALDWGAHFQDAGEAGHINHESGHGPWPEGLMSFAYLMKDL